ncbi:crotonase/enoyl-CoA hydratase family protein [Pseudomonas syringae group genomosp. 3]|uniref:crotonase/enoyl-CoA hydratase family protein n=1 Tax=Pseudomonas syringae group genomosp. 3 TaxID=251701 RepID=UPI000EFCA54F|nr:crotonase/enoyl-CoA hydratase family protein [Pseudomonas syringae group genomosp. 3]
MKTPIRLDIDGPVAIITLDSPDTRNALASHDQYIAIEDFCVQITNDRSIRAVIVTGAGKAFCAGGDIKQMLERLHDPKHQVVDDLYHYKEGIHRIPLALYNLEVPTIAAVNGPAIGAGLDLACMCDVRVASTTAKFAESFVRLGIIPGDGGAFLLQRIVGVSKAAEMTFTGETIDAAEALSCGLVSQVVAPEQLLSQAMELAHRITANPPHALRMAKRLMREAQHARLESVLELSAAYQAIAHSTADHAERITQAVGQLKGKI